MSSSATTKICSELHPQEVELLNTYCGTATYNWEETEKMATANNEFFEALAALEKERGLPADYLIEKIKAAIVIAVKKDYEVEDDNVVVDIDPEHRRFPRQPAA